MSGKAELSFSIERILAKNKDDGKIDDQDSSTKPQSTSVKVLSSPTISSSVQNDQDDLKVLRKEKGSSFKRDPVCSSGFLVKNGITVELIGQELWRKFHKLGTEMIITKAGRRMFPTMKLKISGLDPDQLYVISLELAPYDDKRYRYVYHNSQWMVAGTGDPRPQNNVFVHGESPSGGRSWMQQNVISFDKLKLTNNRNSFIKSHICLHSMHKYLPKIHITAMESSKELSKENMTASMSSSICDLISSPRTTTFAFPETVFTTVTAYQNQQITKLKIASNPFAKGFREATRSRDNPDVFSSPSSESSLLYTHPNLKIFPQMFFYPNWIPMPVLTNPAERRFKIMDHEEEQRDDTD